jgi:stearoyl-CoA desaturase (delta-9 desaturase)
MSSPTRPANPVCVPLDEDAENHLAHGPSYTAKPLARPASAERSRIIWGYAIGVLVFHLLLPLAFIPWLFSWTGLLLIPIGNYVFCSLGIGGGYHRLLTHRGYRCPKWFEHTLAVLGVCALQDTPARWVMIHRMHHQNADRSNDPHSPMAGWFWGHMGWLVVENRQLSSLANYERYARDVLQDRFYLRMERGLLWVWIYAAHAALFYFVGLAIGWSLTGQMMDGVQFGLSLLLWGVVLRTVYSWHITWGVNSWAHMWGYRNYETDENSRNNWVLALATNGDGWHNNHHADPRSAAHGFHRWWELDVTYLSIRLFQLVGIVSDVAPVRRRLDASKTSDFAAPADGAAESSNK